MLAVRRPEIAQRIHDAKEHGDLSENAEYEDAKNEQAFVEGRIQTLESMIKNATLIDEHTSTDHVQIGSTVKVKSDDGPETFLDRRVGRGEAGPGPHLQRVARGSRPARAQEGREGRRQGPRRATSRTRSSRSASAGPPDRHRPPGRRQPSREARTWTGRTSSRRASMARRSSTTPRRRPGTVHVGSLRGPVILDVITRALRARGLETTLLYGVDDLDPMDAQALLSPDAIEREMGRPLAHVPDPAGDCHAELRAPLRRDLHRHCSRASGILPDRYYWMSDIYPTGQMDPFIRTALDRAEIVREVYRRVANVQHPDHWLPVRRHLPELRQGRARRSPRTGTARPCRVECRPRPRRRGRSAAAGPGRVSPVRRRRRSCPGTSSGRPSGACSA